MAVLLTPPYLQFFDSDGVTPLAGGKVYTYSAGTTTPKATFTTSVGDVAAANPVILNSVGQTTMWISGSYKFVVTDSSDVVIDTTDNVTAFSALPSSSDSYFESFSGNGTQTAFTTSEDLGADEKAIYVWVDSGVAESVTNGDFATDSAWTKGSGWSITGGEAVGSTASTALSQTSAITLIEGQAYALTYTITRSAGSIVPSIGGRDGASQSSSGTYTEVIVAGSSQLIAFTGTGFTGTVDNVSVSVASSAGYSIQNPGTYTIDATTLTFATAPAAGTNNIYVSAPSLLVGAAASSASDAADSATAAAASQTLAAADAVSTAADAVSTAADVVSTNADVVSTSADAVTASQWASLTTGLVAATDYSAKAWAIGGTGTTTNNAKYYSEQAAGAVTGDILPMTEQGSAPSTPVSGVSKLYFDTDHALSAIDDDGLVRVVSRIQIYSGLHATPLADELPLNASTVAKTSGGTYNGDEYERVYSYIWDNVADGEAAVAGGRGASAAADFAANKAMTLPDFRDRALIGVSAGDSITTVAGTAGATTVSSAGTNTGTAITAAQMPSHTHSYTATHSGGANEGVLTAGGGTPLDIDRALTSGSAGSGDAHTHTYTGDATSVLQKSIGVYWYISF